MQPHAPFNGSTRSFGVAFLLAAILGCGADTQSPAVPETGPALTIGVTAAALVFSRISTGGGNHTCGVTTDGRAYCWGGNGSGQLGDGTLANRTRPTAVLGDLRFRQVNAGQDHSCGITTDNHAYCWGSNLFGRLGDGTTTERHTPVRVLGGLKWKQLGGGNLHTCGVTLDDKAYCWGNNANGALGDGTRVTRLSPTAVSGARSFEQIEAGNGYTCGVATSNQAAFCWGAGSLGQLGDGSTAAARLRPRTVSGNRRFDHVNAGWNHTCGVTVAGRGFCWGQNNAGQLGDGSTTNRSKPASVAGDLTLQQVGGGVEHTCARTTAGQAYCWGTNNAGQLGDGTNDNHPEPEPVAPPI